MKETKSSTRRRLQRLVRRQVENVAIEVMDEMERKHAWYGDPDLLGEIASRANVKGKHPLTRGAGVLNALSRSKHFRRTGYIRHLSRDYPIYERVMSPNDKS